MRILHVSDLHIQHDWFNWVSEHCTGFDLLVVAGDLLNLFSTNPPAVQAQAVSTWLESLRVPTVAVTGNHDVWCDPNKSDPQAEGAWLRKLLGRGNVIGVDGEVIEFAGLKIAANGWLQTPPASGIDILVTHAPPCGCASAVSVGDAATDIGDPELWDALRDDLPKLILSGHVHQPRRVACKWPPIFPEVTVLVPGCDEQSEVPLHWVIDTNAGTATHSNGEVVKIPLRKP